VTAPRTFNRFLNLLPFAAVALGAMLFLYDPHALQVLRNSVFDQFQRWHPREYREVPVTILDIDDESLARLGQWPWPRTRVAEMVDKLHEAGAASVGMDIVFAEPDRTSPKAMMALWKLPEETRARLGALPDHDEAMAKSLQEGRVVVGFALDRTGKATAKPATPFRIVTAGEPAERHLNGFTGAVTSLPAFEKAASGNGFLTFVPDDDGVVRRVPLVARLGEAIVPSLVSESLRVAQGVPNYIVRTGSSGEGVEEIRIGEFTVPTTAKGEMWVHYTKPVPGRFLPAWKVLAGEVPAGRLDGHIVLVGTSAQGLMDLRSSPMGGIMAGVEAHAQGLEQILAKTWLERPAWAYAIEPLLIVIGGIALALVALKTSALVAAGATLAILAAVAAGAWYAFTAQGLLLDPLTPSLVLVAAFILGSVVNHLNTEREGRWVRDAFSRYVSPNRVDYLVSHPDNLELGGKRQECSFIFTDLAGFTGLMEAMDPGAAVSLLNDYLDRMIEIAFRNGGTLDRIVGDAVAIMFSAPVEQPDHRARAMHTALEMHAFATRYVADLAARGIQFGHTRIGIHSGEVIVGNFGGSNMFDYRALGDPVNTAARLESVNKHLGTLVCVSEATLSGCADVVARPVGRLVLKGKSQALKVFEPIVPPEGRAAQRDIAYEEAYALLETGDSRALAAFEALRVARPDDPLVNLHLGRLNAGDAGDRIVLAEK
jgi:adenylate cyclase